MISKLSLVLLALFLGSYAKPAQHYHLMFSEGKHAVLPVLTSKTFQPFPGQTGTLNTTGCRVTTVLQSPKTAIFELGFRETVYLSEGTMGIFFRQNGNSIEGTITVVRDGISYGNAEIYTDAPISTGATPALPLPQFQIGGIEEISASSTDGPYRFPHRNPPPIPTDTFTYVCPETFDVPFVLVYAASGGPSSRNRK